MKKLMTLAALMLACGCATTKQERCDNYEAVYTAYLTTTGGGIRPVSKEEAAAAAAAALFLRSYCGWQGTRGVDANGVEVVRKPE